MLCGDQIVVSDNVDQVEVALVRIVVEIYNLDPFILEQVL